MKTIETRGLQELINKDDVLIVDVREKEEFAEGHIPHAINIPLSLFDKGAEEVIKSCTRKVVIHCKKGGRGKTACEMLKGKFDDKDIYNLEGGITSWQEQGGAVLGAGGVSNGAACMTKTGGKLPIIRQVMLVAGILVLLFGALGFAVDARFFYGNLFVGLGLFISGATGFCGMAILLAKMPWNK